MGTVISVENIKLENQQITKHTVALLEITIRIVCSLRDLKKKKHGTILYFV